MAMQPDGQTALHLAAEEATLDCTMLEVKQNLVKVLHVINKKVP